MRCVILLGWCHILSPLRQISTLNAAHELPSTVEEALLLWLRKVSEAVTRIQQQQRAVMLQVHAPSL